MKIETLLQDLDGQLAAFIESSKKIREEESERVQAATRKIIGLGNRFRGDIDRIYQLVEKHGLIMEVIEREFFPAVRLLRSKDDVIAGMDFECDTEQVVCRYWGKEEAKTSQFPTSSVDYERDLVPAIANFFPYALDWEIQMV
jgi:hypothetical protein